MVITEVRIKLVEENTAAASSLLGNVDNAFVSDEDHRRDEGPVCGDAQPQADGLLHRLRARTTCGRATATSGTSSTKPGDATPTAVQAARRYRPSDQPAAREVIQRDHQVVPGRRERSKQRVRLHLRRLRRRRLRRGDSRQLRRRGRDGRARYRRMRRTPPRAARTCTKRTSLPGPKPPRATASAPASCSGCVGAKIGSTCKARGSPRALLSSRPAHSR